MDFFSTRLCTTGTQSKNHSALMPSRNTGFHPVITMTSICAGSESAGLCYMGHFGGDGQCYPTHQLGFPEKIFTG
jgi:hypothetical protein